MTLGDLLNRVSVDDKDKMIIFHEEGGWSNVNVRVGENEITIFCDDNSPFSSEE